MGGFSLLLNTTEDKEKVKRNLSSKAPSSNKWHRQAESSSGSISAVHHEWDWGKATEPHAALLLLTLAGCICILGCHKPADTKCCCGTWSHSPHRLLPAASLPQLWAANSPGQGLPVNTCLQRRYFPGRAAWSVCATCPLLCRAMRNMNW